MTIKGIDVSNYQSATYDLTGHDFVFVKATQSTNYVNPKHADQVKRARDNGRVTGHYHYLTATASTTAQMDYFLTHAAPRPGEILAVDWEEAGVSCAEKDAAIKYLRGKAGGRKVLLYCSQSYWTGRDTTGYAGDGLWVAQYNGKPGQPSIKASWLLHQYTDSPVDTSVAAFASRAEMAAWAARHQEADVALTDDDVQKVADAVVAKLIAGDGVLEGSDLKRIWTADVVPAARPPYSNSDYYGPDGKTVKNGTWTPGYTQQTQTEGIRETLARVKALQTALAALDPAALEAALVGKLEGLKVEVTVTEPKES
ncbi:glycoside hydrolase family 25 protein [Streptomyces sp. NPDC048415]|uniref:glycoside hydrolase family 25 protein n=1 Tax=Streptomyces sp. NPDC048415 TaxID=3154822 RepID=UPI0034302EEA